MYIPNSDKNILFPFSFSAGEWLVYPVTICIHIGEIFPYFLSGRQPSTIKCHDLLIGYDRVYSQCDFGNMGIIFTV